MLRHLPAGLCAGLLLASTTTARQDDWPCFQGPTRTGTTGALDSKLDWGEAGPPVLWRTATGPGFGGVAVQGGEVFLFDHVLSEQDLLRCFDLETGSEKWSAGYEVQGRLQFPGSRSVPAVSEDLVYTCGGFGHVAAFDRKTHEIAWMEHLEETYDGELPIFGWSCAPLVVGDLVIYTALGEGVGLVALDRHSGEERWVSEPVGYSHSTPALLHLLGQPQIVFLSTSYQGSGNDQAAPTTISSFDPQDGSLLWRTETMLTRVPVPPPVQVDDSRFFVTGGYRSGSTLMRISREGDGYAFEELFHIERGAQTHQPILHDGYLYLAVNENWNDSRARRAEGGLLCLDLEGKERWRTGDSPYLGRGSVLLAGDRLLLQDGYSGVLRVVRASPEGFQVLAQTDPFGQDDGRDHEMWAPMALAGGRLLLRSQEELVCLRP